MNLVSKLTMTALSFTLLTGCTAMHKKGAAKNSANHQEVATTADGAKVTCTNKAETRTIESRKNGAGCDLIYTKGSEAKTVASSKHGSTHCNESSAKIKAKLVAAGWKCQ